MLVSWATGHDRVTDVGHNRMRAALYWAAQQRARAPRKALFSSHGTERHVELRDGAAEGFLWFAQRFAVDFHVPPELITADWWQTKKCAPLPLMAAYIETDRAVGS